MPELFLKHYGVKGQKKGIRRYQNEDGSLTPLGHQQYERMRHELLLKYPEWDELNSMDSQRIAMIYDHSFAPNKIVIKAGKKLQRLTNNPNEDERGYTYASYKSEDNDRYYVEWGKPDGFKTMLEITDDLIIPIYQSRVEMATKAIRNADIDRVVSEIGYGVKDKAENDIIYKHLASAETFLNRAKDMTIEKLSNQLYKDFSSSLAYSEYNRKIFFEELEKQGYNAVVDDWDKGFAKEPIIILDRSKNTKQISSEKINFDEVMKKAEKLGYSEEDKQLLRKLYNQNGD